MSAHQIDDQIGTAHLGNKSPSNGVGPARVDETLLESQRFPFPVAAHQAIGGDHV
jgi:hypothetical protein